MIVEYKVRWSIRVKEHLGLIVIISITLAVGGILIVFNLLPEQQAMKFNPLSETPIKTDFRILKTPSPGNNTYVYALNDVAEEALHIAENDKRIKQIVREQKDKAMTIAAVQPTVVLDDGDGNNSTRKASYKYAVGQIIIAANWQYIDGKFYSSIADFNEIRDKIGESHQRVWNIFVDLNKRTVSKITEEPERVMSKTVQPDLIYATVNMFMPDIVKVNAGSEIKWRNDSNLPHNVVGTYKKTTFGSQPQQNVTVDSGFIQPYESWKYNFNDSGVFEYHCTIHSAHGMKGTIVVA
jgi:plastocyanin